MRGWKKTVSALLLVVLSFTLIVSLAFPTLSDPDSGGRVKKTLKVDFPFLRGEHSEYVLLYFGYVGCTHVCMPALQDVARLYQQLEAQKSVSSPAFYFVNMTLEMDSSSVQSWTEQFNPRFKSYAPDPTELNAMVHALNALYLPMEGKAEHRPYLYLLQRKSGGYELSSIYTSSPYNSEAILEELGVQ